MLTFSEFKTETISQDFRVWANGTEIPVYTCRISAAPFNAYWPGHQRQIDQTEIASFVNIITDETVSLEVDMKKEYKKLILKPYSKGIPTKEENGKICFEISSGSQLVLSGDDMHNPLFIFCSKLYEQPAPSDVTYYFGAGTHNPGKIVLKANESVYADKDALIYGCIYAENAENIRIFGNGVFDDSNEERTTGDCYAYSPAGNIKLIQCKNAKVEGVLFRDAAVWCVNIFNCSNVEIDNIKVFGQWRYNTDGIDIVNSNNITVRNSFVYSFDDSIVIKGIDKFIKTDNENILVENCVVWNEWGHALEIGFETACRRYRNIIFRNCDIIKTVASFIDIQDGDCAEISDVLYENINVEYNIFDEGAQLQNNDEQKYVRPDKIHTPVLLRIGNLRFREMYKDSSLEVPYEMGEVNLDGIEQMTIHDITVKNMNVYYDEKIGMSDDGRYNIPVRINSTMDGVEHYNINILNVKVNGVIIDEKNCICDIFNVKDLNWSK